MTTNFAPTPIVSRKRHWKKSGITLVELMVAMTISLIMVYAMLAVFTNLTASVSDGRAAVEISGQLRNTTHRLRLDLRGVTVPMLPWLSPETAHGYFEYREEPGFDQRPLFPAATAVEGMFGDFDDVLAATIFSQGQAFNGQIRVRRDPNNPPNTDPDDDLFSSITAESHYAETVWWCAWDPTFPPSRPSDIVLRRRALIIRPDVALFDATRPGLVDEWQRPASDLNRIWIDLENFYDHNDISCRPEVLVAGGNVMIRMWANSLADLTRRENRFCHRIIMTEDLTTNPPSYNLFPDTALAAQFPFEMQTRNAQVMPSLYSVIQRRDKLGEDVIQANVLAFDLKAYDAGAAVINNVNGSEILSPHDVGYGVPTGNITPAIGMGTFVDLFYMRYVSQRIGASPAPAWANNPPRVYPWGDESVFSGPPAFFDANGNNLFDTGNEIYRGLTVPTYDTWSYHYEQDGVDQDGLMLNNFYGAMVPNSLAWRVSNNSPPDQGTNGLDDDGNFGVDDPFERETSPPYPYPLRAIQASIRSGEADSRQVRQMSVVHDFTPE